ncbi:MAG TPA: glycosyltransferase family 4 protein [Candidatus Competibacteraceae bacterium]|nr:glycosyltransferase family 4 protein [Candidatus Competibacteraceae bacterium]
MRIAYLCKRQYMSYDVIADRYARLYEQPRQLALRGHEVLGLCLSYRPTQARDEWHPANPGRLRWIGLTPGHTGGLRYPHQALRLLRAFAPDVVVGASDALLIILSRWLAGRLEKPLVIDLYDNFESFGLTGVPGVRRLYRQALRHAHGISCISPALAHYIQTTCQPAGLVIALESTINVGQFRPMDRTACRQQLGLPPSARLIGTAGALDASRGIDTLYRAFYQLTEHNPDIYLVLAGRTGSPIPTHPRILYLGELPHDHIPAFFNALNIAIICIRDTAFGRYSFPQKAYEILACRIPLVAAALGSIGDLLKDAPDSLYRPDDDQDLASKITRQLNQPRPPDLPVPTWADQAEKLERLLVRTLSAKY